MHFNLESAQEWDVQANQRLEYLSLLKRLFGERYCPLCRGGVIRVSPEFDASDFAVSLVADWPFWIMFGICTAAGMVHWLAGAIGIAVSLPLAFTYWRYRSRYRCTACSRTFTFSGLVMQGRSAEDVA